MGTTAQKLQAIVDSKADVKTAIIEKGVAVGDDVPFAEYGNKIRQIPTGGSGTVVDRTKPILFFDYDGTLVASYTLAEAQALTALPSQPIHDLLTGTGCTHTLAQVKAAKVLHVGATYRTSDGKTYAFVTLTEVSGLDLPICFTVSGTATIRVNWGDGQTQDVTATSTLTHNYESTGRYIITLERISGTGTYSLGWGTSSTTFIGVATASYRQTLTKCYIGDNVTSIGNYAFYQYSSLASLVIPNSVTSIGNYAFQRCPSLTSLVIPDSVGTIGSMLFYDCHALTAAIIPIGVKSIGSFMFTSCYPLASVVIPDSVTSIGSYAFNVCRSFTSLVIPRSVTSIDANGFMNCSALNDIILESETPPTLGDANVFTGGTSIRKYYVPDGSVEAYKTATNWATYADYIYPISSRP